jgi:hypothetical protein
MQSDAGKTRCATGPTGGEMTGDLACFFRRKTQARFHQSAVCREAGWLQGLPVNGLYGRIQAARKNMNQRFLSLLFIVGQLALALCVRAGNYDVAADFSTNSNPNGVWSYGYATNFGGSLILYTDNAFSTASIIGWRHNISAGTPAVFYNRTGDTNRIGTPVLSPHQACFHPGPDNEYSIYRFTAPAAGNYQLQASFVGADSVGTTTDVHVLLNDSPIFSGSVNGFGPGTGPSFSTNLVLKANDRIDFEVGDGPNDYQYDSTGIQATLTSSAGNAYLPPGRWLLLVVILFVVIFVFISIRRLKRFRAPIK